MTPIARDSKATGRIARHETERQVLPKPTDVRVIDLSSELACDRSNYCNVKNRQGPPD